MKKVCNYSSCTGCGVCESVCPKNCIEMRYNNLGAFEPQIDQSKCIECGMCQKKCPNNNLKKENFKLAQIAYYAKVNDKKIYNNSSSGGIATQIALYFIKRGGVVYAAVMNTEKVEVSHLRITSEEKLYQSQGSKYVQSKIGCDTYKKIEADVKADKDILFIGTPCQVAGVQAYLGHDADRIFYVDLVCHGIPGEQVFKEYIYNELKTKKLEKISFRTKKFFCITYSKFANSQEKNIPLTPATSLYYHGFMSGSIYRKSCYNCKYAKRERLADVTLGDTDYCEDGQIYSSVILYSDKSNVIFKQIKGIKKVETELECMLNSHAQLNAPMPITKEQQKFEKYCAKGTTWSALKRMNRKKTILTFLRKKMYGFQSLYRLSMKVPGIRKILRMN